MLKNKTKSNLRIIFSSLSLISFVLFSLCDNLIVTEYTSYYTYGWRLGLMNDLFLFVPFAALLVFAILERKLEHVNGRAYITGLFALFTVQALFVLFGNSTSEFSIFTCSFLGRLSDITIAILIVRMVMFFLIPIAHKIMLKIYSLGMVAFLWFVLISMLTSDSLYLRYRSVTEVVISLIVDILFHVALFFFSDLLSKENESTSQLCLLGGLAYSVFGKLFDDIDEYDLFEEDEISEMIASNNTKINQGKDNVRMSKYYELFSDDALKHINTFDIGAENFLLDPIENAVLHYEVERHEENTIVSGYFKYTFTEEQATRMLKKKSVLNKTFEDISLCAQSDADIGVESIEEGIFTIRLASRAFDTSDSFDEVREYMFRFMEVITIIQNTESYE